MGLIGIDWSCLALSCLVLPCLVLTWLDNIYLLYHHTTSTESSTPYNIYPTPTPYKVELCSAELPANGSNAADTSVLPPCVLT